MHPDKLRALIEQAIHGDDGSRAAVEDYAREAGFDVLKVRQEMGRLIDYRELAAKASAADLFGDELEAGLSAALTHARLCRALGIEPGRIRVGDEK